MSIVAFGAYVGLATGIFTLLDRMMYGRPLAWIRVEGNPANSRRVVRVENIGRQDILITGAHVWPRVYGVARDDEGENVFRGALGDDPVALIRAGDIHDFPLIRIHGGEQFLDEDNRASSLRFTGASRARVGFGRCRS
jgi:hypothetical protein